ncbi:MAG TPA: hypothetical protein VG273_16440 [Bryobacteraceae bacterium]|jgi:hypothetical protein|nr:hypothetical protein [Bryobacteraceae bacterium]
MKNEAVPDATGFAVPEPDDIREARNIVGRLTEMIDAGDAEEISVYVARRDGTYLTMQNRNNGRHEDAGRILELALLRLGFVQVETVRDMVDDVE